MRSALLQTRVAGLCSKNCGKGKDQPTNLEKSSPERKRGSGRNVLAICGSFAELVRICAGQDGHSQLGKKQRKRKRQSAEANQRCKKRDEFVGGA